MNNKIDIEANLNNQSKPIRKYRDQNIIGPAFFISLITFFLSPLISCFFFFCFRRNRQKLGVMIGIGIGIFLHGLVLLITTTSLAQAWCGPGINQSNKPFCEFGKWIVLASVIIQIIGGIFIAIGSHYDTINVRAEEKEEYHTQNLIPKRHR